MNKVIRWQEKLVFLLLEMTQSDKVLLALAAIKTTQFDSFPDEEDPQLYAYPVPNSAKASALTIHKCCGICGALYTSS